MRLITDHPGDEALLNVRIVDPSPAPDRLPQTITVFTPPRGGQLTEHPWGARIPGADWPLTWLVASNLLADWSLQTPDRLITLEGAGCHLLPGGEHEPLVIARETDSLVYLESPGPMSLELFWEGYWHLVAQQWQRGEHQRSACVIDRTQAALAGPWLTCLRIARMPETLAAPGRYLPQIYAQDPAIRHWHETALGILALHLDLPRHAAALLVRLLLQQMELLLVTRESLAHRLNARWESVGLGGTATVQVRADLRASFEDAQLLGLPVSPAWYQQALGGGKEPGQ